jgi:hypothetical protein
MSNTNKIVEPFRFSVFIIIFIIVKSSNKSRENQYQDLIENIKQKTEIYVEQTKSSTLTIGLNNRDFYLIAVICI